MDHDVAFFNAWFILKHAIFIYCIFTCLVHFAAHTNEEKSAAEKLHKSTSLYLTFAQSDNSLHGVFLTMNH